MNIYQQLKKLFGTLWKYLPDNRKPKFLLMLIFSVIARLLRLINPFIIGKVINIVQEQGLGSLEAIKMYVLILIITPLVARVFHGFSRIWQQSLAFEAVHNYRNYLFGIVTGLSMQWHQDNHSGTIIDRINKATNALSKFGNSINSYGYGIINFFGALLMLLWIQPKFLIVLITILGLILLIIWKFDIKLVALGIEKNNKDHKISSLLFDYLSNIKTLITLRFQSRAGVELNKKSYDILSTVQSYAWVQEIKRGLMGNLNALMSIALIIWYIYSELIQFGTIKLGNVTMILQYMGELRGSFDSITWYGSEILHHATDIGAVDTIISSYQQQHSSDYQLSFAQRNRTSLTIKNLSFSYKNTQQSGTTLENISLNIQSGKKIAFVGASGSGKSTMLALLRGLYMVDDVQLQLDENYYNSLQILVEHTSLIPQDPEIFENTMRYNITCGLEVDDTKILEYCRLARFDEVLDQLPNGLDTDIKEKGVNLSGGQKQRLALARGLLLSEDSDMLLLDEPTSSVDATNEKIIFTNILGGKPKNSQSDILQFFNRKTIIAVMHRLHLLEMFDYIYVFDQGKIVEEGSFQSLLLLNGKLATLWRECSLQREV